MQMPNLKQMSTEKFDKFGLEFPVSLHSWVGKKICLLPIFWSADSLLGEAQHNRVLKGTSKYHFATDYSWLCCELENTFQRLQVYITLNIEKRLHMNLICLSCVTVITFYQFPLRVNTTCCLLLALHVLLRQLSSYQAFKEFFSEHTSSWKHYRCHCHLPELWEDGNGNRRNVFL